MSIYIIDNNYSTIIINKYGSLYQYYKNNNIYKYNNSNDELINKINKLKNQFYKKKYKGKKTIGKVNSPSKSDIPDQPPTHDDILVEIKNDD